MRNQINQPVVPVQLTNQLAHHSSATPKSSSTKLAVKIQLNEKEIRIYNGIEKYILYALLKELA